MDATAMPSQGYLSHSETESWAVIAASMPVTSPEIRLGPVRICVSISERAQTDKFLILTVSKVLDDLVSVKSTTSTRKGGKGGEGGEPHLSSLPTQGSTGQECAMAMGGPATGSPLLDLEITVYSGDRKTSIGHVTLKDILQADKKALELTNILAKADLVRYRNSVILDFCVHGLPVSRPRSLIALWQDASTADAAIQCVGSEGTTQVLVHKAFVLDQIPNLGSFVGLDFSLSSLNKNYPVSRGPDEGLSLVEADSGDTATKDSDTNGSKEAQTQATLGSGQPRQQQQQPQEPNIRSRKCQRNEKRQNNQQTDPPKSQPYSKEMKSSCPLSDLQCTSPPASCSDPASSSFSYSPEEFTTAVKAAACPTSLTTFRRPGIEVWKWPSRYPATSCRQVMAWIYRQELPSEAEFQLQDFELLMELCESLKQQELYQHYVALAQSLILLHTRPVALFGVLNYDTQYAHRYLKPVLVNRMVERPALFFKDQEISGHLAAVDPSGIIYDFLKLTLKSF